MPHFHLLQPIKQVFIKKKKKKPQVIASSKAQATKNSKIAQGQKKFQGKPSLSFQPQMQQKAEKQTHRIRGTTEDVQQ